MEELELLGKGGCASVHLCRRKHDNALVAVKRIPLERLSTPQQQERLRAEQQILSTLRSPFLCRSASPHHQQDQAQDDDRDKGYHSIPMEYIDGKPLYQCIWRYKDRSGRLPEVVARFFAAQIVLAVRTLHSHGFVHRDLKSGNVLIDQQGFAKVIDFGFAKQMIGGGAEQRTRSFCGTHYITAPEIFTRGSHGFEADWWSLGVVIYEMVVGRPPWAYKPTAEAPLDSYFESVAEVATRLQTEEFVLSAQEESSTTQPSPPVLSRELRSLLRGLLAMKPEQRLSASEVMAHAWFDGVEWGLLEAKGTRQSDILGPYSLQMDFLADAAMPMAWTTAEQELSSAESIDPEDDAKYFADF